MNVRNPVRLVEYKMRDVATLTFRSCLTPDMSQNNRSNIKELYRIVDSAIMNYHLQIHIYNIFLYACNLKANIIVLRAFRLQSVVLNHPMRAQYNSFGLTEPIGAHASHASHAET